MNVVHSWMPWRFGPVVAFCIVVAMLGLWSRDLRSPQLGAPQPVGVVRPDVDALVSAATTSPERLAALRVLLEAGRVEVAEAEAQRLYEDSAASEPRFLAAVLDVWVETLWRARRSRETATLDLAQQAVDGKKRCFGPEHPEVAVSLLNLARVYRIAYRYDDGTRACDSALDILTRAGRAHSVLGAKVIAELATIHFMTGASVAAIDRLEEARAIYEALPHARQTDLALVLNVLAVVYGRTGEYVRARRIHERALEIRLAKLGPDHPKTAETYNNLAVLLSQMGDDRASLVMRERVVQIRLQHYGMDAPLTVQAISNVANMRRRMGDDVTARLLYRHVLDQLRPEDTKQRALTLSGLGLVEQRSRDYASAWRHFTEAREIHERRVGRTHTDVAQVVHDMAALRYETGDFVAAEQLCRHALEIRVQAGLVNQPAIAEDLVLLAEILARHERTNEAFDLAVQAEAVAATHLAASARTMSRREALQYAHVRARGSDLLVRLALRDSEAAEPGVQNRVRRAWDALIRSRALVLEEMMGRLHPSAMASNSNIDALHERWQAAVEKFAALTFASRFSDSAQRAAALQAAREETEAVERALALARSKVQGSSQRNAIGLGAVLDAIPADAALVAYTVFGADFGRDGNNSLFWLRDAYPRGRELAVLVVQHGQPPRALALGPMHEVDQLVGDWSAEATLGLMVRGRTAAQAEHAYRTVGGALRRAIWEPVRAALGDEKRIFIVPEASLHLVTHAALPGAGDTYLADSNLRFHYLTAERDLVRHPNQVTGHGVLALGGADFDAPQASLVRHESRVGAEVETETVVAMRGVESSCPELESLHFEPLQSTQLEVEELARTWERSDASGPAGAPSSHLVLTGSEASVAAFKRFAPGRRFLHLATHGFFLGNGCASAPGTRSILSRATPPSALPENPFLLSGLAFAGANARSSRSGEHEDGILTAEEIAVLDLRGVEWAVLSACETGRGEIQSGEGVLGLRRAFRVAGVRSVITSLWAVADEPTYEWMQALYEARLDRGRNTLDAVYEATGQVLRARRARGANTHPFYWAGFVATGDWD